MLKSLLLFLLNLFKTNAQLRLENIILRKQIEILQRTNPKLKINKSDRLLFSIMKDLLSSWKEKLFIVKPETVIKWHRTAFRSYWKRKSRHKDYLILYKGNSSKHIDYYYPIKSPEKARNLINEIYYLVEKNKKQIIDTSLFVKTKKLIKEEIYKDSLLIHSNGYIKWRTKIHDKKRTVSIQN